MAVDEYQQRHASFGFPVAVVKKFADDQAGKLAALIAYYGFFSLFPLLLLFATILGFVLNGNPSAQHAVLHSALSQFPIYLSPQLLKPIVDRLRAQRVAPEAVDA